MMGSHWFGGVSLCFPWFGGPILTNSDLECIEGGSGDSYIGKTVPGGHYSIGEIVVAESAVSSLPEQLLCLKIFHRF
jgi:hypothetical protein